MSKLSISIIKQEHSKYKSKTNFGAYMCVKYNLNDAALADEVDVNMALLRLMKDHVYTEKK
jgi:hypothetical protein|tara:strand:+ start:2487 stop:2669 length:183 start_codon:yes stop_codon:yes gene_type:complete